MKYEKTKNISFPLGGIGTGCLGLQGNGELNDWEIFNRPNKNTRNGYSHFAIKAVHKGKPVVKVLHGDTNENLIGTHHDQNYIGFGFGPRRTSMAGFPHFKNVEFEGRFPIATLIYRDDMFPGIVRLNAFNPLIPHDDFNSSLPVAFFEWEIENTTEEDIEYAVALSVENHCDCSQNKEVEKGCFLFCADKQEDEIGYCDMTVLTDCQDSVTQAYWYRGEWQDDVTTYWNNFLQCQRLPKRSYETFSKRDHATVASYIFVGAGEKKKIRFVLAWNAPIQYNYWSPYCDEKGKDITWKNYYATQFNNSIATANYALTHFEELYAKTWCFVETLHKSSLPSFVIDAISANLSVLKSPTVLRLEDGSIWAWEGVHETNGSCEGTCQHVWNYAYALPFLFPKLERSIRDNTIKHGLFAHGETTFRVLLPLGRRATYFRACVDGQMGEIIKAYREWKVSGDNEWLRKNSEAIFSMLEFAWSEYNKDRWDANCDGVIEGRQHHTLDVELFGENSWLQGFYLLALDCASKMAEVLGERDRAEKYKKLYKQGKIWTNENLFNGEYFGQKINLDDRSLIDQFEGGEYYWNEESKEVKYQIGEGCIIDQMLADWHAAIIGVEGVFDTPKKHKALESLYKYNYKPSMRLVTNMWRNYALNDEAGSIICAYPEHKRKPAIPIPYCEETMTGFEYALGGLMISQGYVAEGEAVVKGIRDRYDGEKRNPWNEIECGSNYARSMASYALLLIYSGFTFDMTKGYIGFKPIVNGNGSYFWSVGNSYGDIQFYDNEQTLVVLGNAITLTSFGLKDDKKVMFVAVDGKSISFSQVGNIIYFSSVEIKNSLEIKTEVQ